MRQVALSMIVPLALFLAGCTGDDNTSSPADASTAGDGSHTQDGSTTGTPDTGAGSPDGGTGSPDTGTGPDAASASLGTLSFVARFSESAGQLPEGLWAASAGAGAPIVGWAPLATLVTDPKVDGGLQTSLGTASGTFTLGITGDATGDLYVGVAAASAIGGGTTSPSSSTPAPGIYRVPSDGGAPSLFSAGATPTPQMNAANGLVFVGSNLFVADSEGVIYEVGPTGAATVWSSDPTLAPASASTPGCATDAGPIVPLMIGANGIAVDAARANLYVTNTDFGRILRFPITSTGPGSVARVVEDCAIAGADGIQVASDGSLIVAINAQNRIVRVTQGGALTVLAEGGALQTPASLLIQGSQLLITSSTFFYSAPDGGAPAAPGLLTGKLTLP